MKFRIFSLEEANELLPKLRSLLEELQSKYRIMEETAHQWEMHRKSTRTLQEAEPRGLEGAPVETKEKLREIEQDVISLVQSINKLGCVLRDPHAGLVDFPGIHNKEPIYLCWVLGEDSVQFYHGPDEGFQGRKPL